MDTQTTTPLDTLSSTVTTTEDSPLTEKCSDQDDVDGLSPCVTHSPQDNDVDTALTVHDAIARGLSLKKIERLLIATPWAVHTADAQGRLPLHFAAMQKRDFLEDRARLSLSAERDFDNAIDRVKYWNLGGETKEGVVEVSHAHRKVHHKHPLGSALENNAILESRQPPQSLIAFLLSLFPAAAAAKDSLHKQPIDYYIPHWDTAHILARPASQRDHTTAPNSALSETEATLQCIARSLSSLGSHIASRGSISYSRSASISRSRDEYMGFSMSSAMNGIPRSPSPHNALSQRSPSLFFSPSAEDVSLSQSLSLSVAECLSLSEEDAQRALYTLLLLWEALISQSNRERDTNSAAHTETDTLSRTEHPLSQCDAHIASPHNPPTQYSPSPHNSTTQHTQPSPHSPHTPHNPPTQQPLLQSEHLLGFLLSNQVVCDVVSLFLRDRRFFDAPAERDVSHKLPLHYAAAAVHAYTAQCIDTLGLHPPRSLTTHTQTQIQTQPHNALSQHHARRFSHSAYSHASVRTSPQSAVTQSSQRRLSLPHTRLSLTHTQYQSPHSAQYHTPRSHNHHTQHNSPSHTSHSFATQQLQQHCHTLNGALQSSAVCALSALCHNFPAAARERDREGRTPLHYLVTSATFSVSLSRSLDDDPVIRACVMNPFVRCMEVLCACDEREREREGSLCGGKRERETKRVLFASETAHHTTLSHNAHNGDAAVGIPSEVVREEEEEESTSEEALLYAADHEGRLPLHLACILHASTSKPEDIATPTSSGVRYDDEVEEEVSPVRCARFLKEVLLYIIQHAPQSVRARDSHGRLPLHYAVCSRLPPDMLVLLLREDPSSVMCQDEEDRTPLQYAVLCGASAEVVHLLYALAPQCLHTYDKHGKTPLQCANRRTLDTLLRVLSSASLRCERALCGGSERDALCGERERQRESEDDDSLTASVESEDCERERPTRSHTHSTAEELTHGETALHFVCARRESTAEEVRGAVLAQPLAVAMRDRSGRFPLHCAVRALRTSSAIRDGDSDGVDEVHDNALFREKIACIEVLVREYPAALALTVRESKRETESAFDALLRRSTSSPLCIALLRWCWDSLLTLDDEEHDKTLFEGGFVQYCVQCEGVSLDVVRALCGERETLRESMQRACLCAVRAYGLGGDEDAVFDEIFSTGSSRGDMSKYASNIALWEILVCCEIESVLALCEGAERDPFCVWWWARLCDPHTAVCEEVVRAVCERVFSLFPLCALSLTRCPVRCVSALCAVGERPAERVCVSQRETESERESETVGEVVCARRVRALFRTQTLLCGEFSLSTVLCAHTKSACCVSATRERDGERERVVLRFLSHSAAQRELSVRDALLLCDESERECESDAACLLSLSETLSNYAVSCLTQHIQNLSLWKGLSFSRSSSPLSQCCVVSGACDELSLEHYLRSAAVSVRTLRALLYDAARALRHLHRGGFVHCAVRACSMRVCVRREGERVLSTRSHNENENASCERALCVRLCDFTHAARTDSLLDARTLDEHALSALPAECFALWDAEALREWHRSTHTTQAHNLLSQQPLVAVPLREREKERDNDRVAVLRACVSEIVPIGLSFTLFRVRECVDAWAFALTAWRLVSLSLSRSHTHCASHTHPLLLAQRESDCESDGRCGFSHNPLIQSSQSDALCVRECSAVRALLCDSAERDIQRALSALSLSEPAHTLLSHSLRVDPAERVKSIDSMLSLPFFTLSDSDLSLLCERVESDEERVSDSTVCESESERQEMSYFEILRMIEKAAICAISSRTSVFSRSPSQKHSQRETLPHTRSHSLSHTEFTQRRFSERVCVRVTTDLAQLFCPTQHALTSSAHSLSEIVCALSHTHASAEERARCVDESEREGFDDTHNVCGVTPRRVSGSQLLLVLQRCVVTRGTLSKCESSLADVVCVDELCALLEAAEREFTVWEERATEEPRSENCVDVNCSENCVVC